MATETKRGPRDRKQVDVHDPSALLEIAQYLRKSPQAVAFAASKIGADVDEVAAFLGA